MNTASTISQRDAYKLMLKDYPDVMSIEQISSVVRLWQIHGWSRSFQVALSRAGNPGTARNFGHSDPYLPEAI